jgi:hypothetical protein
MAEYAPACNKAAVPASAGNQPVFPNQETNTYLFTLSHFLLQQF